jgi:hypothetical protein
MYHSKVSGRHSFHRPARYVRLPRWANARAIPAMAMILSVLKLRLRARYSLISVSQLRRKDRRDGALGSEEEGLERWNRDAGKYFDLQRSVDRSGTAGVVVVVVLVVRDGLGLELRGPSSSS